MTRRRARIAAAALVATTGLAATAAADPGVRVTLPGRAPVLITAAQITAESDVPAGDIALKASADRPADRISHPAALSIRKLLALAGADPDGLTFLSIPRPRGGLTVLRAADLADPPPFADGPPLVWIDGPVTHLLRPQRDDDDLNAADDIATTADTPLQLDARTGALLDVRAAAAPATVAARKPVTLTATVDGALAGETLTVTWHFDDGSVGVGTTVRHAYALAGSYRPYATVGGSAGSGGASDPVAVQVGAAPARAPSSSSGPGGGGGTGAAGKAPASGPSNGGGGGGGGGSTTGSGGSGSSGTSGGSATTANPGTVHLAPQATGAPSGDVDPVTGLAVPSSIASPSTGSDRAARQPRTPVLRVRPVPLSSSPASGGSAGTPVSGELIAAADRAAVGSALIPSPARGGAFASAAARRGADRERSPLGLLAGLAALAVLLGGGALREVRRR